MRIAFRADGSPTMGTGHVMRCLTLAEAARERGHDPMVFVNDTEVDWLEGYINDTGLPVVRVPLGELTHDQFAGFDPERILVDSYDYSDDAIDAVAAHVRTAVIVDFNDRDAAAAMYIDPNLGGKARGPHGAQWLVGSEYTIIRPAIRAERDEDGATFDTEHPRVLVFVGGSDPLGLTAAVARAITTEVPGALVSAVGSAAAKIELLDLVDAGRLTFHNPGTSLPRLMGESDVIVCAAGTSAWDVSTIGKPALFIGVVDNQMVSIAQIRQHDLGPVVNATELSGSALSRAVQHGVREILADNQLRLARVQRMTTLFDGRGASRIIDALCADLLN
jgi:spore coat polysaccharide biosynthesis predicted glycosyltransferase SpsG